MNRSNLFFSLNKREDWEQGFGMNTEIAGSSVSIAREEVYRECHRWSGGDLYRGNPQRFIFVDRDGLAYYIAGGCLYLYDWAAAQSDMLFELNLQLTDGLSGFCIAGGKAVFMTGGSALKITVVSVHSGQVLHQNAVSLSGGFSAAWVENTNKLYLIDDQYNLYETALGSNGIKNLYRFNSFGGEAVRELKTGGGGFYVLTDIALYGFNRSYEQIHEIPSVSGFDFLNDQLVFSLYGEGNTVLKCDGSELYRTVLQLESLRVDHYGRLHLLHEGTGEIAICAREKLYCRGSMEKPFTGIYYLPLLDSGEQQAEWTRFTLNAVCPPGTQVNVSSYAFDDHRVNHNGRHMGLDQFMNASDITSDQKLSVVESLTSYTCINPENALFFGAVGRYMLIKLELWGQEDNTPLVNQIRVYFNEESFIHYLPEIFQTGESSDFLKRFIKIMESLYVDIEERIGFLSNYIDIDMADDQFLRWLAGWMDFETDETWKTESVRKLLSELPDIYRRRGTKKAIVRLLTIYLGYEPIIVENHELKGNEGAVNQQELEAMSPFGFTIISRMPRKLTEREKVTVKKMLDRETPAYTHYRFIELDNWIALDKQSYLSINSSISDSLPLRLDGYSMLPYHSRLEDDERLE